MKLEASLDVRKGIGGAALPSVVATDVVLTEGAAARIRKRSLVDLQHPQLSPFGCRLIAMRLVPEAQVLAKVKVAVWRHHLPGEGFTPGPGLQQVVV